MQFFEKTMELLKQDVGYLILGASLCWKRLLSFNTRNASYCLSEGGTHYYNVS